MARELNNITNFIDMCLGCGASPIDVPLVAIIEPPGLVWNINFPRVLDLNYRNRKILSPLSNNSKSYDTNLIDALCEE